jgi:hypothetical protein
MDELRKRCVILVELVGSGTSLIIATTILIVSVCVFAYQLKTHEGLLASYRQLRDTMPTPYTVNGLRIPFESPMLARVQQLSSAISNASDRTLLLVSSDACPATEKMIPRWIKVLESLPFNSTDQVAIVTAKGQSVPGRLIPILRRRNIRYEVFVISEISPWIASTGLSSTPRTLVLDSEQRVRFTTIALEMPVQTVLQRLYSGSWPAKNPFKATTMKGGRQ